MKSQELFLSETKYERNGFEDPSGTGGAVIENNAIRLVVNRISTVVIFPRVSKRLTSIFLLPVYF